MSKYPTRRTALQTLTLGAAATGLASPRASAQEAAKSPAAATQPAGVCTLLPQAVEGPFYFDPELVRADITEGKPGQPVRLALHVIESGSCKPLAAARVDVWHCDASGVYSGYDQQGDDGTVSAKGAKYLRGTQMTDGDGRVTFMTVFPGWYPGRTPHIHVKVFLDQTTLVTGQIYFPEDVSARVYANVAPYSARPKADTTNSGDFLFEQGESEGGGIILAIADDPAAIVASLVIAVGRSGAAAKGNGVGGFFRRMIGQ